MRTQVPTLSQLSRYRLKVGWTVVYTAMPMEAENPSTENKRARYLGKTALYPCCVSSVAMPSSSSYTLEVSSGAVPLAFGVALSKILRKVGIEIRNTNIKAVKLAKEWLGERSIEGQVNDEKAGSWRARIYIYLTELYNQIPT